MIGKLVGMVATQAGIEWIVDFTIDLLYNLDKDNEGWDDKLAFTIEKMMGVLKLGSEKKIKKACYEALDLVQYHLENLDDNDEGFDDEVAHKIAEIKDRYFTD